MFSDQIVMARRFHTFHIGFKYKWDSLDQSTAYTSLRASSSSESAKCRTDVRLIHSNSLGIKSSASAIEGDNQII